MKNVLILGSSGFIGAELSLALVRNGFTVYGLTRRQEKADQLLRNEIIPIVVDVREIEKWLPIALKVDIIIEAIADLTDYRTPFKIQEALLKVYKEKPNTIFIYTSGVVVYGDIKNNNNNNNNNNNENGTNDESTPYFSHKFIDWRIKIEKTYKEVLGAIIIQPTFLYGKDHSAASYYFEAATKSKDSIKIYGDENCVKGFIHIFDLVNFYQLVIKNALRLKGQTLIANSYNEKIKDVITCIASFSGNLNNNNKTIEYLSKLENSFFTEFLTYNQNVSFSKATTLIGYYPLQPSLTNGIERYYNSWLLSRDKNTAFSKLIGTVLP
ncbi:hypothetical protein ACTFIY_008417 [Dictyostelium cf. discoideum]